MSENVVYLHPQPEPVAHCLRLDFLKHDLDPAARIAENATKLALANAGTAEMLQRTNERLARLGPVLRDLHATVGDGPHARAPARRGNRAPGARTARR